MIDTEASFGRQPQRSVDVSFLHRSGRVEHNVDINAADLPKENQSNETFGYVNNLP